MSCSHAPESDCASLRKYAVCVWHICTHRRMDVTFKQIAEIALAWGVKPNAIRVWRQRAIPFGQSFHDHRLVARYNGFRIQAIYCYNCSSLYQPS